MPTIDISDASLRSLKPGETHLDYWDAKLPAFGVRVAPSGTKTFIVNQHRSRQSLGQYPIISLSEARTEAKRRMAEKTLGKVRPRSITYPDAVKVFLEEKQERRRTRTVSDHKRHLNKLGFKCQLADVTHADMERKLKRLPPSEFNHRLSSSKTFFTWAQKKRYITDNPTVGLSPHPTKKRKRILSDAELKAVWTAAGQMDGHFGTIVKLLITTGQRRSETAALRRDWYSHNAQTLCFPAEITKNGREHTLPLSELSLTIVSAAGASIGQSGLLFPARGASTKPFNGWSKSKKALDQLAKIDPWTLHDLRRSYRSNLGRLGVSKEIAERLVNHISARSEVEQIYDQYPYLEEMRAAQQKYETWLADLLELG